MPASAPRLQALARPRRTRHQDIVIAGGGDFQRALDMFLSPNIGEVFDAIEKGTSPAQLS